MGSGDCRKKRSGTELVRMADGNSGIVGDADLVLMSLHTTWEKQVAQAKNMKQFRSTVAGHFRELQRISKWNSHE
jgi:hypothetical protein